MDIKRSGSQPPAKGPADYFTGTVRIDPLFEAADPARVVGASVTFEPGARTAWHTHPLGQTLIVTAGSGLAQRWGGPIGDIRPGDVIWFRPGEKHWQGASVVMGARRGDRLQSLANELTGRGGKALAVATDVTHCDHVKRLVDAAVQTFGRIDVMINNAGIMPRAPLERLTIDDWNRTIDINIKGVLYGIAAALPHMKQQKAGHMIFVSSVAGHKVGPDFAVYAASKFAVRVLAEGLRLEVKPYNIRTTVISPGAVATELPNSVTEPDIAEGIHKYYDERRAKQLEFWKSQRPATRRPRQARASTHHDRQPGAAAAPLYRRCRCHCPRGAEGRGPEGADLSSVALWTVN